MKPVAHFEFHQMDAWTLTNAEDLFYWLAAGNLAEELLISVYCQFIAAFVFGVTNMPPHQFETQLVPLSQLVQLFPLLDILDGLKAVAGLSFPAAEFPILDPLGEALLQIGAVSDDMHSCGSLEG